MTSPSTPAYVAPKTFDAIHRSTRFFVQESGAMAVGAAGALLRAAIPSRLDGLVARLGLELEVAALGDLTPASSALPPWDAARAVVTGVVGIPFFLAVGAGETAILVARRILDRRPR